MCQTRKQRAHCSRAHLSRRCEQSRGDEQAERRDAVGVEYLF